MADDIKPQLVRSIVGKRCSNSFLDLWFNCPWKWYLSYWFPTWVDGVLYRGLRSRFVDPNLIKGSVIHEGVAELYRSGCRDGEDTGEWDLDKSIVTLEGTFANRRHEYRNTEDADNDLASMRLMLVNYYDEYGPKGLKRDWPEIKVVMDKDGQPLIERPFTTTLPNTNYEFICIPDVIVEQYGFIKVMEHKTSVPSWVSRRLTSIHMDPQFTGELFTLTKQMPDRLVDGILCNVLVKGNSPKFGVAARANTSRAPQQLADYGQRASGALTAIDMRTNQSDDSDPFGTLNKSLFPATGQHVGYCGAYNRDCEMINFCRYTQPPEITLRNFRPSTPQEVLTSAA